MTDDQTAEALSNLRVLVTRATHQSGSFSQRLRSLGAEVLEIPALHITTPETFEPLDSAIRQLTSYTWIIFSSANAVHAFFERAEALNCVLLPDNLSIAAIGAGTAKAIFRYGHHTRYQPAESVAESFVTHFPGYPNLQGVKILWPKGDTGRWVIRDKLAEAGAQVTPVVCYRSTMPPNVNHYATQLALAFQRQQIDAITVASGQTAKNLVAMAQIVLNEDDMLKLLVNAAIVTIGPETSAAARELGFRDIRQAAEYTTEGMIGVLESMAASKRLRVSLSGG